MIKKILWEKIKEIPYKQKSDLYKDLETIRTYNSDAKVLIEINNLKQSFKTLRSEKIIYENLSFKIYENERTAFLGGNGAGKTITTESICGYRKFADGKISYNYDYVNNPYEKLSVQFQDLKFPLSLTVKDLIDFVIKLVNIKIDDLEEFNHSLEIFELKKNLNTKVSKLSGGQQQRLNVFLSLLNKPKVLFLDEFTTGLDIAIKNTIQNFIMDYCDKYKISLILISHDNNAINEMCDRIIILANKQIMIDISKDEAIRIFGSVENLLNKYIVI
ncbi:MAG: ATP-binding cassette domain-containing protein [Metamycoplasmataceae bacterium]